MMDFQKLVKKSILASSLPKFITEQRRSPRSYEVSDTIVYELNTIFSRTKIDPVGANSVISLKQFKEISERISLWYAAITYAAKAMDDEFSITTDKYARICRRIINNNVENRNKLNELLNYSCHHIDNIYGCDKSKTSVANIGSFITLPFSFGNTKIYDGQISFSLSSVDQITFSNESSVTGIPLQRPVTVKYKPSNKTTEVMINIGLNTIKTNLVYINASGNIDQISMKASKNGNILANKTMEGKECLFNFNSMDIDSISFTIVASQLNLNKQSAININDIIVFEDIYFMQSGQFESSSIKIDDYIKSSKILLNAVDYNQTTKAKVDKYLSVALVENIKSFIKVSDSYSTVEVPISKIIKVQNVDNITGLQFHDELIRDPSNLKKQMSVRFFHYDISEQVNPDLLNINYKTMAMMAGCNDAYGSSSQVAFNNDIYENWTKVDNVWKTMCVNYETGVNLDIGMAKIKINGKIVTGKFQMPIGFSLIEVHESLFDKTFGNKSTSTTYNGIASYSAVVSDPLFPNNFAYKLAGLPIYNDYGAIDIRGTKNNVVIDGVTVVQLDDPVMPLSVRVTGAQSFNYKLFIGNSPIQPGTFTVEPNKGLVRIFARGVVNEQVDISFIRAQRNFRPCGILFNRLQKYINFRQIHNMISKTGKFDDTFISFVATEDLKTIMIPEIKNVNIFHSKLIYSTGTTSAYAAVRLLLKTNDNELSPIIKNIFLEGKK